MTRVSQLGYQWKHPLLARSLQLRLCPPLRGLGKKRHYGNKRTGTRGLQSGAPATQLTGIPRPNSCLRNFWGPKGRSSHFSLLRLATASSASANSFRAQPPDSLCANAGFLRASRKPLRFLRRQWPDRAARDAVGKQPVRLREEESAVLTAEAREA